MENEEKVPLNENADENDRLIVRYQNGDESAQDEQEAEDLLKDVPDASENEVAAAKAEEKEEKAPFFR